MFTKSTYTAILCLAILTVAILFIGCIKDDSLPWPLSELPPATQTGENTFGCLINGEPFVPGIYTWNPLAHKLQSVYDEPNYGVTYDNRFSLHATYETDSIYNSVGFGIFPVLMAGMYEKANSVFFSVSVATKNNDSYKIYYLDTTSYHEILIKNLDTVKNIASGTFEMDMREIDDSTDILQIRHGRFDVRYFPE